MILKQTFRNHLLANQFNLFLLILLIGILIYFNFEHDALVIAACMYFLFTLPAIILHIVYFIINKGEEIEIKEDQVIVRKNGLENSYREEEISEIEVCKSANMDNGIPLMGMEYYFFARIIMKDGRKKIITCLVSRKVDKILRQHLKIPFSVKRAAFCLPR